MTAQDEAVKAIAVKRADLAAILILAVASLWMMDRATARIAAKLDRLTLAITTMEPCATRRAPLPTEDSE